VADCLVIPQIPVESASRLPEPMAGRLAAPIGAVHHAFGTVLAPMPQNVTRELFFDPSQDFGHGVLLSTRADQQVNVLGHEDICPNVELPHLPRRGQCPREIGVCNPIAKKPPTLPAGEGQEV